MKKMDKIDPDGFGRMNNRFYRQMEVKMAREAYSGSFILLRLVFQVVLVVGLMMVAYWAGKQSERKEAVIKAE